MTKNAKTEVVADTSIKGNEEAFAKIFKRFKENKSACIRYYLSKGYTRKDIAMTMSIRYQFVNNVRTKMLEAKA